MKIHNISCTQFAGLQNRSVDLEEGINIIYGQNESGKSTLVNLLSRTLFQNARIDKRTDKEFCDLYFPGAKKESRILGDTIDGEIAIETDEGTYKLIKEWGAGSRCKLSTPAGDVIRDQNTIDELLRDLLLYGEGVYTSVLFSSQRNTDTALQTILDATKKQDDRQEIADAVTMAFAESGGTSVDIIEQAVDEKIKGLAGSHWDIEQEKPMRKAGGGRWSNGKGDVLQAYYDLEDAQERLARISELEMQVDKATMSLKVQEELSRKAEENFGRFSKFSSQLTLRSERKRTFDRLQSDMNRFEMVLKEWPKLVESIDKAKALKKEQEDAQLAEKYAAAMKAKEELAEIDQSLASAPCPTGEEIQTVKTAQRGLSKLENQLCGMNLTARLNMLEGHHVEIKSLVTGEPVEVSGQEIPITGAVSVTVPGVMEMRLSPANVNTEEVEAQITEQRDVIAAVLKKYGVDSLEALEAREKAITEEKAKLKQGKDRLAVFLGSDTFEDLEKAFGEIQGDTRRLEDIENDIVDLCGNSIDRFIAAKGATLEGYVKDFGSLDGLKAKAFDTKEELEGVRETVEETADIPDEYQSIPNPEAHLEELKLACANARKTKETAVGEKSAADKALETYQSSIDGDPAATVERAKRIFEDSKSLLAHWLHIAQVVKQEKEKISNSPMQDLSNSFANYLGLITSGKVSAEFPEVDKLNMSIYSGDRLLDYGKLSEGTKETVSLAFRLAILDHLFPNGGGVIVLDDPLTDMDNERVAQSCRLVKECAKRHQVIFLTCREDYLKQLEGNVIRV